MQILGSGPAPGLRGGHRYRASTGDLRSVVGRILGSFLLGHDAARVVIAVGRGGRAPYIVLDRAEIAMLDTTSELWAVRGPDGAMQRAQFRLLDLHLTRAGEPIVSP